MLRPRPPADESPPARSRLLNGKLLTGLLATLLPAAAGPTPKPQAIAYVQSYVRGNNFSGSVLVEREGKVVFQETYGFEDRERRVPNSRRTRFHVASVSMQSTAAAVLRLVDEGALRLESAVGDPLPGMAGAERITIRDLLTERSGRPDINESPTTTRSSSSIRRRPA
jgi:CubicO group peptidase (beta-lactamase class C family)